MENIYIKYLDILIEKSKLVAIIGPSNAGKTYLLKKICGRLDNSDIYINNKSMNSYDIEYKKKNIVCVFNNDEFKTNYCLSELKFYLNLLNISDRKIDKRINDFIEYFKLEKVIDKNIEDMCLSDKIFIKILSLLIIEPKLICIDDLLTYLNKNNQKKLLKYIKENNITLISVTTNMEELFFFDKVLVLENNNKLTYDSFKEIINNESIFNKIGYNLPFINDINNLLKSYDLVNEEFLTKRELIEKLWK